MCQIKWVTLMNNSVDYENCLCNLNESYICALHEFATCQHSLNVCVKFISLSDNRWWRFIIWKYDWPKWHKNCKIIYCSRISFTLQDVGYYGSLQLPFLCCFTCFFINPPLCDILILPYCSSRVPAGLPLLQYDL